MKLAVLADDLTGALDTGVLFREAGFRTRVVLPGFPVPERLEPGEVLVVDTETRHADPTDAAVGALAWGIGLRSLGVERVYKKMDSTLRGPWVEELEHLCVALEAPEVHVCPALPEQGRTVVGGYLYLHGQRAGDLRGEIARRSGIPDSLVVPPARTTEELAAVVRRCEAAGLRLLCGSAGLARAWAEFLGREAGLDPTAAMLPRARRVLVAVGSRSGVSREQAGVLAEQPGVCRLALSDPATSLTGEVVLLETPPPDSAGERLELAAELAEAAARVHREAAFDAFVVTGGETAIRLLEALGAQGLELERELLPGAPLCRLQGGTTDGAWLVTKAGSFGEKDTLVRAVEALTQCENDNA